MNRQALGWGEKGHIRCPDRRWRTKPIMSALWAMVAGLMILSSLPAEGGEARRCLRDGKVIITDVSCELLGNAIDLAPPLPEKHFKRGEPEKRPVTAPTPVEKILPPLPIDPIKPPASSPLRQLLSQLLDTLLIPFLFIAFLSAWLAQQTKKSAQRHRWDRQPKTEGTRLAAKSIEPSDGGTGREAGISRRELPSGRALAQQNGLNGSFAGTISK